MSGFREPRPDLVTANPGGPQDPLGESVMDPAADWLRVFEPSAVCLVIGRHQDPGLELHCEQARADGIAIHRRVSGGGAVVLAPGMVVIAMRMKHDHLGTTTYLERVNRVLAPALTRLTGARVEPQGLGDLTIPEGEGGPPLKILGTSLRQSSGMAVYLGSLLIGDHHQLMRRYLRSPSRQPAYRRNRGHAEFCAGLGRFGATAPALASALQPLLRAGLSEFALRRTA